MCSRCEVVVLAVDFSVEAFREGLWEVVTQRRGGGIVRGVC